MDSLSTSLSLVDEDCLTISSESTYYVRQGGVATKRRYSEREKVFDSSELRRIQAWNLQVIAAESRKGHSEACTAFNNLTRPPLEGTETISEEPREELKTFVLDYQTQNSVAEAEVEPYNPHEGDEMARQTNESIQDFLARLVPSTINSRYPWIWCANFSSNYFHNSTPEDVPRFKQLGFNFLEAFARKQHALECSFDPPRSGSVITRMMASDRIQLTADLINTAKVCNISRGKWMLFCRRDEVDMYWAKIVIATAEGRLGVDAKVATGLGKKSSDLRLICVYTKDFDDLQDVRRVLKELARLKLVRNFHSKGNGGIYYKCDAFTYLDLMNGNEYKIKASMYSSIDLLSGNK